MLVLKALAVWAVLMMVAIALGALREQLLTPRWGDDRARQVGAVALAVTVVVVVFSTIGWFVSLSMAGLLGIGAMWVVLSIGVELALGRLVMKWSWHRLLEEYNILEGRLMLLVWITLLLSPIIAARLREL